MKIIYVLLTIALSSIIPVKADVDYGYVKFNITNSPPRVKSINLIPENPFPDSILECGAEIHDEYVEIVEVYFEWYKNDVLLDEKSNRTSNFKVGDEIKCKITPNDLAQNGTPAVISTIIQRPRITSIIIKNTLNFLGSDTRLEEIDSYQQEGLASITGFAVANAAQNRSTVFLVGIVFILIIVNSNLILRRRYRKTKHFSK